MSTENCTGGAKLDITTWKLFATSLHVQMEEK